MLGIEIYHIHKNAKGHLLLRETCGNSQPNSTCLMFQQEDMDLGIQWRLMWLANPNDIIEPNIGENHTTHCQRHSMTPRLCV